MKIFSETRIRVYARSIALTTALLYLVLMSFTYLSYLENGEPIPGHDFLVFYGAGIMARAGEASLVHDPAALFTAIRAEFSTITGNAGWFYPPIFLPPFYLLSGLPYFAAYLLWTFGTAAFFFWAIRPFVSRSAEAWVILASPAVWYNVLAGQNAFLTGGLIALFVHAYRNRNTLSGFALGLLTVKPHLGVIFPVILLATRSWRVTAAAGATFFAMTVVTILLYGVEPWLYFFTGNVGNLSSFISTGLLPWPRMASPFVFFLSLGAPTALAITAQVLFFVVVVFLALRFIARGVPITMVFAFSIVAAIPSSPHNFLYDWVIFTLPMLILLRTIGIAGIRKWEWLTMTVVYLAPFALLLIPSEARISPGFLPVGALTLLFALRCYQMANQNMMDESRHRASSL